LSPDVKDVDPDQTPERKPSSNEGSRIWDAADHTFFYQIGRLVDLEYTGKRLGKALGIGDGRQADNEIRSTRSVSPPGIPIGITTIP